MNKEMNANNSQSHEEKEEDSESTLFHVSYSPENAF